MEGSPTEPGPFVVDVPSSLTAIASRVYDMCGQPLPAQEGQAEASIDESRSQAEQCWTSAFRERPVGNEVHIEPIHCTWAERQRCRIASGQLVLRRVHAADGTPVTPKDLQRGTVRDAQAPEDKL